MLMTVQTAHQEDIAASPSHSDNAKRALDLVVGACALLLLAPLMASLALAVRLDSPGPSLFRQSRVGRGGRPFTLLKFRTMAWGTPDISTADMSRQKVRPVTRVGLLLRRFSLDELPQLVNVVRGEMSLVGPRPALPSQVSLNEARREAGVEELLPGITGWAQVNGRDDLSDSEKVAHDAYYARNRSLGLDVRILLLTVLSVGTGRGNR